MTRGSSPRLIGRGVELARLRDAVRAVRHADRCVVLLSGEAGIGKSRLIAELERSIRDDPPTGLPATVLAGGCVDVGGSLAYLPVMELLDGARSHQLRADISATIANLRRALGGATGAGSAEDAAAAPEGRAATFLLIRDVLAEMATKADVVAVIDDLQWADRSTLDVVSFLARRLVGTGVLLVLAYRSDELNRRHPLKPVIADLARHATLDHVRLEALSPAEVRAQIAGILGDEPEPAQLDRVVRLADGNPFHVEELLSLDDEGRLPPSLRELLDARLDQLDDASRTVVEVAAVIGRQVNPALLTAVAPVPSARVAAGLRQAVEARILVSSDDGRQYHFRHALFREAVYEGLAPVDRVEVHGRIAAALTDHPALGDVSQTVAIADRARHWLAAGSAPEAFVALLEAARSAANAAAWAEARAAYESALELWDRVTDPVLLAGSTRADILERAAEIAWYEGDARRAVALNRRAQAEDEVVADQVRLGRLSHREASLLDDLGDLVGEGEAAERAFRLVPEHPPSLDRADALSRLGLYTLRRGRVREAIALFEQALGVAKTIEANDQVAENLTFLTVARVDLAEVSRPREDIVRLDEMLPRVTEQVAWSVVATWVPWAWIGMGEYERAIEYAERLLNDAQSRGLDRGVGLWCLAPRALAEFWLGRWDNASATIGRQGDYAWGIDAAVYLRSVGAQIAAGRDNVARGRSLAEEAIEIARPSFPEQAMIARMAAAWVELLDNQPDVALDHVREAWTVASSWEGLVIRSLVLWIGLWASADTATRCRSQDDASGLEASLEIGGELAAAVDAMIHEIGEPSIPVAGGPRLVMELAASEALRLDGRDDAHAWASIGDRFESLGDVPRTVMARQRQAEAALRDRGDKSEAVAAIHAAVGYAQTMGASRLRDRALAVARAARLRIGPELQPPLPHPPEHLAAWGLSKREREVLALLADGRTNRQIGDALFITDKTASVHVTHILDKLGVSRRTEAALLAVRAGIVSDVDQHVPDSPPSGGTPTAH